MGMNNLEILEFVPGPAEIIVAIVTQNAAPVSSVVRLIRASGVVKNNG